MTARSCNSGTTFKNEAFSLSEVNTAALANSVVIRLYVKDSGGARTEHNLATLSVSYYLP